VNHTPGKRNDVTTSAKAFDTHRMRNTFKRTPLETAPPFVWPARAPSLIERLIEQFCPRAGSWDAPVGLASTERTESGPRLILLFPRAF